MPDGSSPLVFAGGGCFQAGGDCRFACGRAMPEQWFDGPLDAECWEVERLQAGCLREIVIYDRDGVDHGTAFVRVCEEASFVNMACFVESSSWVLLWRTSTGSATQPMLGLRGPLPSGSYFTSVDVGP